MRSGLYYPHANVGSESVVKSALLLWDSLEYIVPSPDFRPQFGERGIARAMELLGEPHCPSDDEKREAHSRLKDVVERKLPAQFYFDRSQHGRSYEIYSEKLLRESWRMLLREGFSGDALPNSDYRLSEFGGLLVMSILADCCAGTTKSRITDRGEAYATLAGLLGNDPTRPKIRKVDAYGQLVPICLKTINTSQVTINALIRLREREAKESGHTLRDLRHRYVESIETYVSRLVDEKTTRADAREVERQFAEDMKTDVRDLRTELGLARRDAVFSKEMFTFVVAATGTAASWLYGAPLQLDGVVTAGGAVATVGGVLAAGNKYLKERQTIIRRHPTAYLFEARKRDLEID